jgi:DNA-binding MarR family transcriptional regulator
MTPSPRNGENEADDMALIRRGIAQSTERYGIADFDSVNAIVTLKRTAAELENFSASYCKQGQVGVLMALNAAPDKAMALSNLGEYLVVTRPNITGLIDGLVEDGLVKRVDHPDDRRVVLAQLTPAGREFMRKFVPFHHRAINAITSGMTKQEKRQLVTLLDKLRVRIHDVQVPQLEEA